MRCAPSHLLRYSFRLRADGRLAVCPHESRDFSPAKAQRRKENPLETRQCFAPLRLCGRNLLGIRLFIALILFAIPLASASAQIPAAGRVILSSELTGWETYEWRTVAVAALLLLQTLLIAALLSQRNKRTRVTRTLAESEEFNRRIVESSSDCVKVLDLDGNILYISERGQRLLEVDRIDALMGASWIKLWTGENRLSAQQAVETARQGGIGSFRGSGKTLKETPKSWHTVITPIHGRAGNVERLLAVSRDMTDQELAITALQQSEERFSKAFRGNPQPMSLTTLEEGRYLDVNESFIAMSGYARDEIIDHTSIELKIFDTPEERNRLLVTPLLTNGELRNSEMRFRTKNGLCKILLSSAELLDLAGQRSILVTSSDISARKALEEDLRLSEREFSTLVENSPDIISRLDQDLRYIYISPTFERVTGLPTDCFIGKTPREMGLADYDSQGFELCCRQAILTRTASQRGFDYKGRNYWTRVIPEFSRDGSVESVMTISEDVTDRIQSEHELTKLTVRLFHLQDEERRRIARELHDGTAQNLFAISVNLARLNELRVSEKSESKQFITESQSLIDQSLQEIRTLSYVLHPPLLDQAGLVSALQWYVEGFSKRSGIYVELVAQAIDRLPSEMEMALFRVVQEALTNVRRHSGSEIVRIRLQRTLTAVLLEISDRGRGLQTSSEAEDSNALVAIGVGIPGMRQRLRQLGGNLEILSNGHGTTISAVVPLTNGVNHAAYSSRGRS
jgi:PAS domain S-box-containing protein